MTHILRLPVPCLAVLLSVALAQAHGSAPATGAGADPASGGRWFDFGLAWDQPLPAPVAMAERLLDAPAGRHGRLRAAGSALAFEDGTPFRVWGVNIALSLAADDDAVPPPRTAAPALADKLASYGFNHVRFIGFDGNAPAAVLNWRKHGKLASELLDRLDYFIHELRRRGIYYSFSINNASHRLFEGFTELPPNTQQNPSLAFRTTRIFDAQARQVVADWTQAFFSHTNPYTRLSYARDPANIYFSALNEDSAFVASLSGMKHYDGNWRDRINRAFAAFLRARYRSQQALEDSWQAFAHTGLATGESLAGSVNLHPGRLSLPMSAARARDTAAFLLSLDLDITHRIRAGLDQAGYDGLFTATNKWFGIGSLYADYLGGDYIEGHLYFGNRRPAGRSDPMRFGNRSFIDLLAGGRQQLGKLLHDDRFGLARLLPANLVDRPFIASEWNHMLWSDHAYEGAHLLLGYGAQAGIDGMDIQTFYNHPRPQYTDSRLQLHYAIAGSPLHTAILPGLALAFQRGDIDEVRPTRVVCHAPDREAVLAAALERPFGEDALDDAVLREGLAYVRAAIGDGCRQEPAASGRRPRPEPVSVRQTAAGHGQLVISTARFEAYVGDLADAHSQAGVLSASLAWPGSLSAISLDDRALASSRCMLVTLAGPVRNRDTRWSYRDGDKVVLETGTGPAQLRGNSGKVRLDLTAQDYTPALWQLGSDGRTTRLNAVTDGRAEARSIEFRADDLDSAWVLVGDRSCAGQVQDLSQNSLYR